MNISMLDSLTLNSQPLFGFQNTPSDPTFVKAGTGTMAFSPTQVAPGATLALKVVAAADNTATSASAAYANPTPYSLGIVGAGQSFSAMEALVWVDDGSPNFYTANLASLQLIFSVSPTTAGMTTANSALWSSQSSAAQPIKNKAWNMIRLWMQDGIGNNNGDALLNGTNMGVGWKAADTVDGSGYHTFYAPGISSFRFSVQGQNGVAITTYLARLRCVQTQSIIVIQSDNTYLDFELNGRPILAALGLPMSYNENVSLIGVGGSSMTRAQLDAAYAAGNDVNNHAFDYTLNANTALTGDSQTPGTVVYQIAGCSADIAPRYGRSANASFGWNFGYGGFYGSANSKDGSGVPFSQTLLGSNLIAGVVSPFARCMVVSTTSMIDNALYGWPKDPWYIRRQTLVHAGNGGNMDPLTFVSTVMPNAISLGKLIWFNVHKVQDVITDPALAILTSEMQLVANYISAQVAAGTAVCITPSKYAVIAGA